jgi:hypothetical protein
MSLMDDLSDTGFWRRIWDEGLDGTPRCYRPFLEHKPERVAAVADAGPSGALVHCGIGRDRTGWSRCCCSPWWGSHRPTSPTTTS